jgi:hypothetical protein
MTEGDMATGILVKASVMGYFRHGSFFCTTTSIDKSGMEIECDKVLAKGDVIQCSLYMPGMGRIRADAEVVCLSKRKGGTSRYCLRFMRVTPEHETSLEGAVAEAAEAKLVEAAA